MIGLVPMLPKLLLFTPNEGAILFTLGLGLILVELNRPGAILPGSLGLLLDLLTLSSWRAFHLQPWAMPLLAAGLLLPLWQRGRGGWAPGAVSAVGAMLALATGLRYILTGPGIEPGFIPGHFIPGNRGSVLPDQMHVDWPVALACGLLWGASAAWLARIARRARRNKSLRRGGAEQD